eukprot:573956-Pelagomonas_calceolata.AAC.1
MDYERWEQAQVKKLRTSIIEILMRKLKKLQHQQQLQQQEVCESGGHQLGGMLHQRQNRKATSTPGRLPFLGEPFLHLNAIRLGQQLKQLLYKPPPPAAAAAAAARPAPSSPPPSAAAAFPAPPPAQTAASVPAAHAPTTSTVPSSAGAVPATPSKRKERA